MDSLSRPYEHGVRRWGCELENKWSFKSAAKRLAQAKGPDAIEGDVLHHAKAGKFQLE